MSLDPKQFDDQRLDALLRDVSVPDDLKDSLRQIPQLNDDAAITIDRKNARQASPSTNDRSLTWMMVLAASLVAVAAFAGWQWYSNQNANDESKLAVEMDHSKSNNNGAASMRLAELDQEIATLTAMLDQLEIQNMERRLAQTEVQYETELANQEVQSLIVALADQTTLPLGGNSQTVKSDMALVIEKFPDSIGAEIPSASCRL